MKIISLILFVTLIFLLSSCTEKYPEPGDLIGQQDTGSGCVNCHTNADLLKQVATPLPPPPDGGSGEG